MTYRAKPVRATREVVSRIFTSWNQLDGWLRSLATLRAVAA